MEGPDLWRQVADDALRSLSTDFATQAPIDTSVLGQRVEDARTVIRGQGNDLALIPWIEDLSGEFPVFDDEPFTTSFTPPEPLVGRWRPVVALLCASATAASTLERWNEAVPTDDIVHTIDASADAVIDRPTDASWQAIKAVQLAGERGAHAAKANELLGTVHRLELPPSVDLHRRIEDRVLETVETGDVEALSALGGRLRAAAGRKWSRSDLDVFDDREFEFLVADLWETYGYRTEVTSESRDGGFDVAATSDGGKVLIEVKHWRDRVSADTASSVAGLIPQLDPQEVVLVSTSGFTGPAIERTPTDSMTLVTGTELCERLTVSPLVPPIRL